MNSWVLANTDAQTRASPPCAICIHTYTYTPAFAPTFRVELREQKVRLDKEFGEMLGKIADRKDRLLHMEKKLATLDRTRLGKEVLPSHPFDLYRG